MTEVRFLRYGEFLQDQKQKGRVIPSNFTFPDNAIVLPIDKEEPKDMESSLEMEDELSQDQLMALAQGFVVEFYHYVNHDKLYHGIAPNTKSHKPSGLPEGYRTYEVDVSECGLIDQIQEVKERYEEHGSPLGPSVTNSKKSNGSNNKKKKKNRGSNNRSKSDHASRIEAHLKTLLDTLNDHVASPTGASARMIYNMMEMLGAAAEADLDVARALARNDGLLKLWKKMTNYLEQAASDLTRPQWVFALWTQTCEAVYTLFRSIIYMLIYGYAGCTAMFETQEEQQVTTPDKELALAFFGSLEPGMLKSIKSENVMEKLEALRFYGNIIKALPVAVSKRIAKDKSIWSLLEEACQVDENKSSKLNRRQTLYEETFAPHAAAQAVGLFESLCEKGMELDSTITVKTSVAPGRVAFKMIARGVVPLFMEQSQSQHILVAEKAVGGLAAISRVKDCRLLMLQHPDGVELVKKILASSHGPTVSKALLLVSHLLWDEEWRDPIFDIQGPSVEETALQWACYCMKRTREVAYATRKEQEERNERNQEELVRIARQKFQATEGSVNHERFQLELDEFVSKSRSGPKWLDVEMEGAFRFTVTLRRVLLLLSHATHSDDAGRLMSVDALPLVACLFDIPDPDINGAAGSLMHNLMACMGKTVTTDMFPDPDHILRSIIYFLDGQAVANRMDQPTMFYVTIIKRILLDVSWKKYSNELAARDDVCKFWLEEMLVKHMAGLGGFDTSPSSRAASSERRGRRSVDTGIHQSCSSLTGKLERCSGCGKIEGKKNDFKKCSRCQVAVYCGRACQKADWKAHKKVCASLAK